MGWMRSDNVTEIAGAVAMARGVDGLLVDCATNQKLARVSSNGKPAFAIQLDVGVLHIWVQQSALMLGTIPRNIRTYGFDKEGNRAKPDQPGMHSGLNPFFRHNELICFNPKNLDQAWEVIKTFEG
jgi:hypothetical protein